MFLFCRRSLWRDWVEKDCLGALGQQLEGLLDSKKAAEKELEDERETDQNQFCSCRLEQQPFHSSLVHLSFLRVLRALLRSWPSIFGIQGDRRLSLTLLVLRIDFLVLPSADLRKIFWGHQRSYPSLYLRNWKNPYSSICRTQKFSRLCVMWSCACPSEEVIVVKV